MYGENSGLLRDSMRELLTQHRIQQRIGGAGLHTVPETTTVAERQEIGEQIARYRHAVLVWCHQAMRAANPRINLDGTTGRTRGPAEELRYRLEASLKADPAALPTTEELVTEQRFEMVDLWRQAARACALGEHDFDAGVGYGRLSEAQCMTVIHDAAEVTRALVGLDRRYARIPGWRQLKDPGRLGRAAEVCAAYSGYGDPDYSIDGRGWKSPSRLVEGPALPGASGVLQAQHNLLLHLIKFPDAQSLRVIMDSQRIVSLEAKRRLDAGDPDLAARWQRRAETYGRLVHQARDVGGFYGKGGPAAGQGSVAAARMQKLPADGLADFPQVRRLMRISAGIDERVCTAVEYGIMERLYFQRVLIPAVENDDGELVKGPLREWQPVTGPVQTELLRLVRADLRPVPADHNPPKGPAQNRLDFEAAIDHRPGGPDIGI
ncbi:hypothetical protein GCM10011584_03620 [Nocardioides phosphati]|uniref:DUF222 domain-containing protein n=1 Tax=Nocardioides phosphati TaxID=1867775 RepID=A0ABQ2N7H8_9ACTN|nr:hypothetical protein [Nocardioides phosphati]GGO84915.1 hypothetical protein GCM10011584_03620 [Nocardioides phosphati]